METDQVNPGVWFYCKDQNPGWRIGIEPVKSLGESNKVFTWEFFNYIFVQASGICHTGEDYPMRHPKPVKADCFGWQSIKAVHMYLFYKPM